MNLSSLKKIVSKKKSRTFYFFFVFVFVLFSFFKTTPCKKPLYFGKLWKQFLNLKLLRFD